MSRTSRLTRVALALAVLGGAGALAFDAFEAPIRAAARDYLAYRRVEVHKEVLLEASKESGVDPYLLAAIMIAESGGRVGVVSHKGALGLFQLSTVTAEWRAEKLGIEKPTREQLLSDPLLNARLGANNMAWLLDTYDGDELRALCAYNAGTRKMKELVEAAGGWPAWVAQAQESGRSEIFAHGQRVLRYRDDLRTRGFFPSEEPADDPSSALAPPASERILE